MNSQIDNGVMDLECCGGARNRKNYRKKWSKGNNNAKKDEVIPPELIEPCKVFVSSLRPQVTEEMLRQAMSFYATVENVIIIKDKQTRRSKGYGFVKVKTEGDVERLLNLQHGDLYIQGRKIVIKPARKKISLPGDDSYVRQPLPERDFDLSEPDPSQPTMHMLVDDVMFNIFSYLPLKKLIMCERVCRRWQMLVHRHFSSMTALEISKNSLDIQPPFTKPIVSKLLLLCGQNLRSLKIEKTDFATKQNILKIISHLCPSLEHLDVTMARGILFEHVSKLAVGCRNIKSFIAKNCIDFDDKALRQLLVSYPQLEKLNVAGTSVYGKNFDLLPSTLKELCIERIPDLCIKKKKITEIADRCPNLETLEMRECMLTKHEIEYFGKKCPNLIKLSMYMPNVDASEALSLFKNLKNLTLVGDIVSLKSMFKNLSQIEVLSVEMRDIIDSEVDFSVLVNLKNLKLNQIMVPHASLLTLSKCKNLEEFQLFKWYAVPNDIISSIVKSCPKLRKIVCPSLQVNVPFISAINELMKERSGKIAFEVRDFGNLLNDVEYDKNKIVFDCSRDTSYLYDPLYYDSDASDDESFNDSIYDSDVDLADHYFFHDDFEDDFFNAAVMLAAWDMHGSDLY